MRVAAILVAVVAVALVVALLVVRSSNTALRTLAGVPHGQHIACVVAGGTWLVQTLSIGEIAECAELPEPSADWQSVPRDPTAACAQSGGTWGAHSNGCGGFCIPDEAPMCTEMITPGCECSPGRCVAVHRDTGQQTCVSTPVWDHVFHTESSWVGRDAPGKSP